MARSIHSLAALGLAATVSVSALAQDGLGRSEPLSAAARGAGEDDGPPLLFGRGFDVGGYAGLDVAYTRMFGRDGALVGIQGAVLLDHRLSFGLAGYGWTNPQPGPVDAFGEDQHFETGYGGATLRYSLYSPSFPVYVSLGALVGAGAITLVPDDRDDFEPDEDGDVFALVQPEVELHANITRWMRVGLTAAYRFTSGVSQNGYDEDDLDGAVVGGHLQFGAF